MEKEINLKIKKYKEIYIMVFVFEVVRYVFLTELVEWGVEWTPKTDLLCTLFN